MELKLDDYKLEKSNMTVPEILTLKVLQEHGCLSEILEALQKAGFVSGFANDNITFLSITDIGQMILNRILEEKTEEELVSESDERLTKIAEAMREIYPKGFKRDELGRDAYPWRGSTNSIVQRLRKFEDIFDITLNLEDTIEATRRYVDLQKKKDPVMLKDMRLLKYFIYKRDERQGGTVSDLMDYLETEVGEEVYDELNGMMVI